MMSLDSGALKPIVVGVGNGEFDLTLVSYREPTSKSAQLGPTTILISAKLLKSKENYTLLIRVLVSDTFSASLMQSLTHLHTVRLCYNVK